MGIVETARSEEDTRWLGTVRAGCSEDEEDGEEEEVRMKRSGELTRRSWRDSAHGWRQRDCWSVLISPFVRRCFVCPFLVGTLCLSRQFVAWFFSHSRAGRVDGTDVPLPAARKAVFPLSLVSLGFFS